jgi:hypothetical protein
MRRLSIFVLITLCLNATVHAQRGQTAVGVIVGEPTGVSFKHWLDDRSAIDAALGWSFESRTSVHLHADWLWHDFSIFSPDRGELPLYYGVGLRFKGGRDDNRPGRGDRGKDRFGVRVPVGVAYHLDNRPLEFFAEIVPILDLAPSTKLNLNAAIGARWYFR